MISKYANNIFVILAFVTLVYVVGYFHNLQPPNQNYSKVYFTELYWNLNPTSKSEYIFSNRREFGVLGTRLKRYIKNENGVFDINRKSNFIIQNDTIFFGCSPNHINANLLFTKTLMKNREIYTYDSLPSIPDTLKDNMLYKIQNHNYKLLGELNQGLSKITELDSGKYLLTYPGCFYKTKSSLKELGNYGNGSD